MEQTVKERLIAFLKYKGYSQGKLEKELGWSNGYINSVRNNMGSQKLQSLLGKFPDLSQNWLINGYGEMIKQEVIEGEDGRLHLKKQPKRDRYDVPLVMAEATAGGLPMLDNQGECVSGMQTITCPVQADLAMAVTGQSMEPAFPDGSIVLLRKVNPEIFVEWGNVYVLDTVNGAVLKEVHQAEEKEKVRCVSLNVKFAPYDVPVSAIRNWFKVVYLMCAK